MLNKSAEGDEDNIDSIDNTNGDNVTKAESLDKPSGSRLKTIVLAGSIVLILIIIGIIYYILSNYFWQAKQRRIAEKKCKEYTKYACDHPLSSNSSQIVLGEIAPFGMYPHMAFVEVEDATQATGYRNCGGSLISEEFVLSAAHCIEYAPPKISIRVSLGVVDISVHHPYHLVKNTYSHPLYDSVKYNFLLLELSEKVTFTPYLRPACLNTEYLGKYDRIIATGWGHTEDEKVSNLLKSVDLVIDDEKVAALCAETLRLDFPHEAKHLICAGWPNSSRSVYKGDPGGPLQVISDSQCANMYVQIGVTTFSEDSIQSFNRTMLSLFGIVASAAPWIASIVWPNESA